MARKPVKKLFEFRRVFDSSIADTKSDAHHLELCEPRFQHATIRNLEKVCAEKYGAGHFVALEIGEDDFNSLPLAYWLIKISHGGRRIKKEAFIDDAKLKALRKAYCLVPTEDGEALTFDEGHAYWLAVPGWLADLADRTSNPLLKSAAAWQRGVEAAQVSHDLKSLPEPEVKKARVKEKHPRIQPTHDYVRQRRAAGDAKKVIVADLMTEFGVVDAAKAESIYNNAMRTRQIRLERSRERRAAKPKVKKARVKK